MCPKSYVYKVEDSVDEISKRTKAYVQNIYKQRKQSWFDGHNEYFSSSQSEIGMNEKFDGQIDQIISSFRVRMRLFNKFCLGYKLENSQTISNTINEIFKSSHSNLIVDDTLKSVVLEEQPLTEILDFFQSNINPKSGSSKSNDDSFFVASLRNINKDRSTSQEKIEQGTLNYTLTIFNSKQNCFETDFFNYEDMTDPQKNGKKRFAFHQDLAMMPNMYLVAMVVLNDVTQANKCKGLGVVKLENSQSHETEIEIHSVKNYSVPVTEIINKIKDKDSSNKEDILLVLPLKLRKLDRSRLDENDFVLEKISPASLGDIGPHRLILTLDSGVLSGGRTLFSDPFEVSIDMVVLNEKGEVADCIKSSYNQIKKSFYKAFTCPNSSKCEWKELIFIQLEKNWEKLHLKFKIYKHSEKGRRKLYGFSFLKLIGQNSTFIENGVHNLNVFQVHKNQEVFPADYIIKDSKYERNRKDKDVKSLGSGKFSLIQTDCLSVRTFLQSPKITDEEEIFELLNISGKDNDKVVTILKNYNNATDLSHSKKILFMDQILAVLNNLIKTHPQVNNHIFKALVQTIHPIVTNKKDFGYASDFLDEFIDTEFENDSAFDFFVQGLKNILESKDDKEIVKFTLMSMKLIDKFIVKAYFNEVAKDSKVEKAKKEELLNLILGLGHALRTEEFKELRSRAFKAFYDVENLEILSIVIETKELVNILSKALQFMTADAELTNSVVLDILKSQLFHDEPETLVNIVTDLILSSRCQENATNLFLANSQKQSVRPLMQILYEKVKKIQDSSMQAKLLHIYIDKMFPYIIKMINQNGFPNQECVEEVLLFAIFGDITNANIDHLTRLDNYSELVGKIFVLIPKFCDSDQSFLSELNFEMRLKIFAKMANFLNLVAINEKLVKMDEEVINNFFTSVSSLVCSSHLNHQRLSTEKRFKIITKHGDIRKKLCDVLKRVVQKLYPNKLYGILALDFKEMRIMDSLFMISVNTDKEPQQVVIRYQANAMYSILIVVDH